MSGDGAGIIVVPAVICLAAPIVVTGLAIAAAGVAVGAIAKVGVSLYDEHNRRKQDRLHELEESGLVPQVAAVCRELAAANKKVSAVYNRQTIRISNDISTRREEWNEILRSSNLKEQIAFQKQIDGLRSQMADYEREKARALSAEIETLTDAQDRELNMELKSINDAMQDKIRELRTKLEASDLAGRYYAEEYYKNAESLWKLLQEEYQGGKFCANEMKAIEELMTRSRELLAEAPEAAYAVIWNAIEKTLLSINKAENLQQEWMMQYRTALVLAEEIKAVLGSEMCLGYLVENAYAQTKEEAEKLCAQKGLPQDRIQVLNADDYVYGELADLMRDFQGYYEKLHKGDGEELSIEELYTIIDDLNVTYATNSRKLLFEAKMNLNEALLIDRVETQINDALGGGYRHGGSARSGNCHNGEKHILFEREGNPDEQICVILKNDGWGDDGNGETLFCTEIEVKSIKDNKISEKKRHQIRNRLCTYLNAGMNGSQTSISCVEGTENRLSEDTEAADLENVKKKALTRRKKMKR